jgi:hypothetical protein
MGVVMIKLFVFAALAVIFAAIDLYVINISIYLAAGLAVGWMWDKSKKEGEYANKD